MIDGPSGAHSSEHEAAARVGAARTVAAILLNWCAEEDTRACLLSLQASDYPALRVVLVDNGSEDGSGERLHADFPEVTFVQTGANLGYTGGNNAGIRRALADGCDYVLVLNNDTEVDPAMVSHLVRAAETNAKVGAVGPKILFAEAPDRMWFAGGDFSRMRAMGFHRLEGEVDPDPQGGPVEEVTFLTGCCLLIPAPVAREFGGFEEDFFIYMEDTDLSLRLTTAGFRLLYQPAARMIHKISMTQGTEPGTFQLLLSARNRRRLARRRYGPWDRLRFALFFYPTRMLRLLRYLGRRDRVRAKALWQGLRAP